MNFELLEAIATNAETIDPREFQMETLWNVNGYSCDGGCGTVGCMLGHAEKCGLISKDLGVECNITFKQTNPFLS